MLYQLSYLTKGYKYKNLDLNTESR